MPKPMQAKGTAMTTDPIRLSQLSHGGGCGCKLAPSVLRELLAGPVAEEDLSEALGLLRAHPGLQEAREFTLAYARQTEAMLEPLGDGEVPDALRQLVHAVADRVA